MIARLSARNLAGLDGTVGCRARLTTCARPALRRALLLSPRQPLSTAASPHAAEMLALVESVFAAGQASLAGLSAASMEALADSFEVMPETVLRSSEMAAIEGGGSERVLAICRELGAKRYVTGQGAADYLDHAAFDEAGIAVEYMDYEKRAYPQLHGDFTPFVSALDLLANCGQAGRDVIAPRTVCWKDFVK